jgi:hypothetical protein
MIKTFLGFIVFLYLIRWYLEFALEEQEQEEETN